MHYVDIMIIAFLEGIHSSQGHVLLNMCYNTTLIALIGWLKPCLTGIECWIPAERSKVQRSATSLFERWLQRGKFHKFNTTIQTFEDESANSNQEKCNDGHANDPFNTISIIFPRIWAQWSVDWSHVWLALSVDCRRKCYKLNPAKQAIRELSASFNWIKYIFGHMKYPFQ